MADKKVTMTESGIKALVGRVSEKADRVSGAIKGEITDISGENTIGLDSGTYAVFGTANTEKKAYVPVSEFVSIYKSAEIAAVDANVVLITENESPSEITAEKAAPSDISEAVTHAVTVSKKYLIYDESENRYYAKLYIETRDKSAIIKVNIDNEEKSFVNKTESIVAADDTEQTVLYIKVPVTYTEDNTIAPVSFTVSSADGMTIRKHTIKFNSLSSDTSLSMLIYGWNSEIDVLNTQYRSNPYVNEEGLTAFQVVLSDTGITRITAKATDAKAKAAISNVYTIVRSDGTEEYATMTGNQQTNSTDESVYRSYNMRRQNLTYQDTLIFTIKVTAEDETEQTYKIVAIGTSNDNYLETGTYSVIDTETNETVEKTLDHIWVSGCNGINPENLGTPNIIYDETEKAYIAYLPSDTEGIEIYTITRDVEAQAVIVRDDEGITDEVYWQKHISNYKRVSVSFDSDILFRISVRAEEDAAATRMDTPYNYGGNGFVSQYTRTYKVIVRKTAS